MTRIVSFNFFNDILRAPDAVVRKTFPNLMLIEQEDIYGPNGMISMDFIRRVGVPVNETFSDVTFSFNTLKSPLSNMAQVLGEYEIPVSKDFHENLCLEFNTSDRSVPPLEYGCIYIDLQDRGDIKSFDISPEKEPSIVFINSSIRQFILSLALYRNLHLNYPYIDDPVTDEYVDEIHRRFLWTLHQLDNKAIFPPEEEQAPANETWWSLMYESIVTFW